MSRGITVWEECEHGKHEAHEGWPSDAMVWGDYIDCHEARSVSLTLKEVDHVQGMTHLIDGSPPKVSLWIEDGLLDSEPR